MKIDLLISQLESIDKQIEDGDFLEDDEVDDLYYKREMIIGEIEGVKDECESTLNKIREIEIQESDR